MGRGDRVQKLHGVCKVCKTSQPRGLIRPILANTEMRVADTLSDEGDRSAYVYVCRDCWFKFVTRMSKGAMIAALETLSCDLLELHRTLCEKGVSASSDDRLPVDDPDLPF